MILMMEQAHTFFRNIPKHIWILALIVLVGIFFRVYHFHDWLSFKGDGFRDAIMVSNSYRVGIESLPLLGPRAAGTMLRLGPVFYYFQYAAVSIFDSMSAPVLAYPDLFFSVLAIPFLYLFSRRYFSVPWSLAFALMLATSFLAIEYGRFAWNPNSTVFFVLFFSWALLRLFDADVASPGRKYLFAVLAGGAFGIATQLHFSSFLGLPIVLAIFLLWQGPATRQMLSPKILACFMVSFLIIYTPVLMSEYFKHGENSRQFISALSSKPSVHGVADNVVQATRAFAHQSARILLGIVDAGKRTTLFMVLFLASGFLANIALLSGERDVSRRSFLRWTLLLMSVYCILYIPLAYTIDRPRFFLPFMTMPYIYCGYIILALEKRFGRRRSIRAFAILGTSVVILSNVHSVSGWFGELRASEERTDVTRITERNIKGQSFWLLWTHFERSAEMMGNLCEGNRPIFFFPSKRISEYGHSIEYALLLHNPDRPIILERKYDPVVLDGCYFYISLLKDETIPDLILKERMDEPVNLGGIWVMRFYPAQVIGPYVRRDEKETVFVPEKRTRNSRVYWGDIFNLFRSET